jgi:hypothetical protein
MLLLLNIFEGGQHGQPFSVDPPWPSSAHGPPVHEMAFSPPGGGVGGSLMKQKEGKRPWSKPTLAAVPGDRELDPRTARIAKRFCRLAGGRRLGMAMNGGNGHR